MNTTIESQLPSRKKKKLECESRSSSDTPDDGSFPFHVLDKNEIKTFSVSHGETRYKYL